MKVTFRDHDGKGRILADALTDAGHDIVTGGGDIALIDADIPVPPYANVCDTHKRVVVYPHGGGNPFAGKEWAPHPNTVCRLVPGPGQVDVLTACGYPAPVEVIGWPFSDRQPFRPCPNPVEVLFAPTHQLWHGFIHPDAFESNRRTHDMLAALPINLTVRYVESGGLGDIGITPVAGVTYRQAPMDVHDGIAAIAAADVVVAGEGTFPSLAMAQGCPTVMSAQIRPDDDHPLLGRVPADSWDLFREISRYPLDADNAHDAEALMDLLTDACQDHPAAAMWRDRFVGAPFDPAAFVDLFETLTC